MRSLPILLFLAVLAAASATAPASAAAQGVRATVVLPGFRSPVLLDTVGVSHRIAAPRTVVFSALRAAFDSIGVRPTSADSARGLIGNLEIQATRRLAGQALARWVDCGVSHTGPTANAYRVHLAILATLAPDGEDATTMRIAIAAGAQAFSGPLGDPIACETRGALEERIERLVRSLTATP